MLPATIRTFLLLSIGGLIIHGIEEYIMEFHLIDVSFSYVFSPFFSMPPEQSVFLLYQLFLWILLIVVWCIIGKPKYSIPIFVGLLWILLILESQHLIQTVIEMNYYPWFFSALLLVGIALWYFSHVRQYIKGTKQI